MNENPYDFLLSELRRRVQADGSIVLGLDSDQAGREEMVSLAEALIENGIKASQIRVVEWPAHDPAEWLASGAEAAEVLALIKDAPTWIETLVEATALKLKNGSAAGTESGPQQSLRQVFQALAPLDAFELENYREKVCQMLDLSSRSFTVLLKASREKDKALSTGRHPFLVRNGCLSMRKIMPRGDEIVQKLCNFNAWIEQDILRDDGLELQREFLIRGEDAAGPLRPARVNWSELAGMEWVMREWGTRTIIYPGHGRRDTLRAAIQLLSSQAIDRRVYTHLGWREVDGRRVYLSNSGALGGRGVEVEIDPDLQLYCLPREPEGIPQAVRASLSFLDLAPLRVTAPLWAAVWLAPLCEMLHPAFAMWVYGATGTLKSTLAALVLNHYGEGFDCKHLPAGFTDTANCLERKAFIVKDAPLVIDDFAPQKDARSDQEYVRSAHRVIRSAGNLSARGRLNASAGVRRSYHPRALIIVTGEDLPESESIVARLFVTEVERGDVDLKRLTALQESCGVLPHALAGYLLWLAEHWQELAPLIRKRRDEYRQWANRAGHHLRFPEAVALLATAFEMGLSFARRQGVLDQEAFDRYLKDGLNGLLEGTARTSERASAEKPEDMFLQTLRELLAQGKICLRGLKGQLSLGGSEERSEMLGWYDEDKVYLLPGAVYTRVARHFRERGGLFPVREYTLRKLLKEAGMAETGKGDRIASVRWIEGRNQRVLVLKREALEEG
jgi:hypothetical protein